MLTAETGEGQKTTGLAFLSGDDHRAVTASRLLRNAARVTLRFHDGTEVSSPGSIDIDEKRGLALIDVPAGGRGKLGLAQVRLAPGTTVNCGAVRDSSFGFVQLAISEIHQGPDGVERYILSGEAPVGNSGAPALDAGGNVIGLILEGQAGMVLIPSAFILSMNSSLPVKPWEGQAAANGENPAQAPDQGSMDEIDQTILDSCLLLVDHQTIYHWADEITRGQGYLQGVPQDLYNYQTKLEMGLRRIRETRTNDPSRATIFKAMEEAGANQYAAAEHMIKAIVSGQQTNNWGPQSQDLQKRSKASLAMAAEIMNSCIPALRELYGRSSLFKESIPKDLVYSLGIEKRPSIFRLGVHTMIHDPFYLLIVYPESMASMLELKPGDRVLSAEGKEFGSDDSIEDLKLIVQNNLGKTITVSVMRDGVKKDLKMKIPGEIPSHFLY